MSRRSLKIIEKQKKRKKIRLIARLTILIMILGIGLFVALYFHTTDINVTGNKTYTEKEIKDAVKSRRYVPNTLLMVLKSKIIEEKYFPFIDYTTFRFSNPRILDVYVKELPRAGAFKQGKYYMYFNYSGIVTEKDKKLYDGVPLLEEVKMGEAKLNKPIPVTDEIRHAIVSTTKNLSQKGVKVLSMTIDKNGQITLKTEKFNILLGNASYIEAKVSKLPEIIATLGKEYSSGNIDMTLYTDEQEIITYHE